MYNDMMIEEDDYDIEAAKIIVQRTQAVIDGGINSS